MFIARNTLLTTLMSGVTGHARTNKIFMLEKNGSTNMLTTSMSGVTGHARTNKIFMPELTHFFARFK